MWSSNITGEHYTRDFPDVNIFPPRLSFPTVNTGAGGDGGSTADRRCTRSRTTCRCSMGTHALKFGANYNYLRDLGILNGNEHFATLMFFDDPSVILSNSNGRYPQGFQTPGIVRQWQQANGGAINGAGYWADTLSNAQQFSTWFQDDWRVHAAADAEPGRPLRRRLQPMDQKNFANNATRLALEAIGDPNGGYAEDAEEGHLAAGRICLRPVGRRAAGAARRLRALLRSVQHSSGGGRHLVAEPSPAERAGHADEYGDWRRPAGHLPLRASIRCRRSRPKANSWRPTRPGQWIGPTTSIRARTRRTSAMPTRWRPTPCSRSTTRTSRGGTSCGS